MLTGNTGSMSKPRLTYVGHSYHQKTGSTVFLQDLLAAEFNVTTLWDDSWRPGSPPLTARAINETAPDHLVLFQQLPSRIEFARIRCGNTTWMPMHDGIDPDPRWQKWQPAGLKTLCFAQADAAYFGGLGYETRSVQYYPPPAVPKPAAELLSVFFWLRHGAITWETLKQLLGSERPSRIVLRLAPDPPLNCAAPPSAEDCRVYNVEIHEGWMGGEDYRRLLRSCSVFMAPRPREGIGQAMLEAMAAGMGVIAPDAPTMNEYIRHGENGYLYDPVDPRPLDFSSLTAVRERSLSDCAAGYRSWLAAAPSIVDFVRKPPRTRPNLLWRMRYRMRRK